MACYAYGMLRYLPYGNIIFYPKGMISKRMIEIKNIVKKYGSIYAVNDISFKIDAGEVVGFLGPNGAGKSTTMNILTGYLSATSGSAKIDGVDILENPIKAKRRIGFLPEQPPLYLDMTVNEYLSFVCDLKHCSLNHKKHIDEICEVVGISDVRGRIIGHLSKGYRQRVGIAQALVGNPPVLIFDEPTVGLDPKQIIEVRSLIRSLGKKHTVILSTHILSEVKAACDRIIVIDKGKIVADELTKDIGRAVKGTRKFSAKICGDPKTVIKILKGIDGIVAVSDQGQSEDDSREYIIEADSSIDIKKPLFYALCDARMPLVGLSAAGENLEEIFISIIDRNENDRRDGNAADLQA